MRRLISDSDRAALDLQAMIAPSSKRKSPKATADDKGRRALAKASIEVEEMVNTKTLGSAELHHVVALHAVLHRKVIGVDEEDLNGSSFLGACSAARKLLASAFDGELPKLIDFVRWCWARENRREQQRVAENNTTASRLTWRAVFIYRSTLTDYRAAAHRAGRAT